VLRQKADHLKLVLLSTDVHECYSHYGHSLAEERRYLPCHPSGHHGDPRMIRGNIAEIQLMYANLAVQDRGSSQSRQHIYITPMLVVAADGLISKSRYKNIKREVRRYLVTYGFRHC
jgi:hypothetical protein